MYSTNPVSNADPAWVATHFVSKYYDVLANHPEYLHRFYKGDSMLSVNDMLDEGSAPRTAAVLTEIQELVNKTVAGARATTKHVDAQFSVHGGVLLHVSGVFSLKGIERAFEQTFFLATQENGFYVHNDLLRVYAHSTVAVSSNGNHQPAPVPTQPVAPAVHAEPAPVAVAEPVKPAPPAPRSQAVPPPPAPPPAQVQPAEPAPAASTPVRSAPQPEQPAPAPSPTPTNTTWAALVKHPQPQKDAARPAAPSPAPHTGSKDTVHALPDSAAPQSNGNTHHAPSTAGPQHTHEGSAQPQVHCIIVRNLPQEHLPQELLEQEFEKFGKLRKGGAAITIHNVGRDVGKVAYIKFEDASAVEAALQASVTILDKSVEIQRHEGPLPSYGRGSGGRGMGGGFRGGRSGPPPPGRGPYGDNTGRGGGRGGVDRMARTDRRPSGGPGGPLGAVGPGGGRGGLQGRGGRGPSRREDSGPQDKE